MSRSIVRPEHAPDHSQTLVLVVEDELLIRLVTADALRERGYRVIEADNGDEAVDMLRAGVPIDIVFSDVRMPGAIDGLGLLSIIRARYQGIPVILTSGHLAPNDALSQGAIAFVPKPYLTGDVIERIGRHIDQQPKDEEWPSPLRERQ